MGKPYMIQVSEGEAIQLNWRRFSVLQNAWILRPDQYDLGNRVDAIEAPRWRRPNEFWEHPDVGETITDDWRRVVGQERWSVYVHSGRKIKDEMDALDFVRPISLAPKLSHKPSLDPHYYSNEEVFFTSAYDKYAPRAKWPENDSIWDMA